MSLESTNLESTPAETPLTPEEKLQAMVTANFANADLKELEIVLNEVNTQTFIPEGHNRKLMLGGQLLN